MVKIKQRYRFNKKTGRDSVETSIVFPKNIINELQWKDKDEINISFNKKDDSMILKRIKKESFFLEED